MLAHELMLHSAGITDHATAWSFPSCTCSTASASATFNLQPLRHSWLPEADAGGDSLTATTVPQGQQANVLLAAPVPVLVLGSWMGVPPRHSTQDCSH
jgi:hypothetical protein